MITITAKFKRLAAAFDEVALAPPCESSSASDHFPDDSADLSDMVESFIEREGRLTETPKDDYKMDRWEKEIKEGNDSSEDDDYEDVKDRLRGLLGGGELKDDGCVRRRIIDDVEVACEIIGETKENVFKRKLVTHLRNKGFDAGLCKSKWETLGRRAVASYEYVDVKINGEDHRYIIQPNLAGEFAIARPTIRYSSLLALLPHVFVGKPEQLKQIVRVMCNEMRRSMKWVGMHLPPWRRNGYMEAKWFGDCQRKVNKGESCGGGKRRWVGFEESSKTKAFWNCRDDFGKVDFGFIRVGRLTAAFNGSAIGMESS